MRGIIIGWGLAGLLAAETLSAQALRPIARPRSGFTTGLTAAIATDTDVAAYESAIVSAGGAAFTSIRRQQMSTLVAGLKADGVWSKLDWFVLCAGPDAVAGRYNIRTPAKAFTVNGTLTFTADRGFQGDGSTGYLDAGEAFTATGNQFAATGATFGVWANAQGSGAGNLPQVGENGAAFRMMLSPSTSGNDSYRMFASASAALQPSVTVRTGHRVVMRTGGTNYGFYAAGSGSSIAQVSSSSASATASSGLNITLLKANASTYGTDRIAAFWSGTALTAAEVSTVHARLYTYLSGLGAN